MRFMDGPLIFELISVYDACFDADRSKTVNSYQEVKATFVPEWHKNLFSWLKQRENDFFHHTQS
jgi:hypothetical protein